MEIRKSFSSDARDKSFLFSISHSLSLWLSLPLLPLLPLSALIFPFNSSLPSTKVCFWYRTAWMISRGHRAMQLMRFYFALFSDFAERQQSSEQWFPIALVSSKVMIREIWHNSVRGYSLCYILFTIARVTGNDNQITAVCCSLYERTTITLVNSTAQLFCGRYIRSSLWNYFFVEFSVNFYEPLTITEYKIAVQPVFTQHVSFLKLKSGTQLSLPVTFSDQLQYLRFKKSMLNTGG